LADAKDAFARLAEEDVAMFDEIQRDELETRLGTAAGGLETLDHLLTGMTDYIRGLKGFVAGLTALEEDEVSTADEEFSTASDRFDDSNGSFGDAEEAAPADVERSVVDLHCISGAMRDASGHYANGSLAQARGDTRTGNEEFEAGHAEMDRCTSSSNPIA
jgi:hypothetical protein